MSPRPLHRWHAVLGVGIVAGLLALLLVLGPMRRTTAHRPDRTEVPMPAELERLDAPIKTQFLERHSAVMRLLSEPGASDQRLADALGELGIAFHAYQHHAQAEACYARAFALAPRSFRWAYALGLVRHQQGSGGSAEAAFREALRLEPENVPTRVWLAELALESGRRDEAASLYREALARDHDCARAQVGLARLALDRHQPAEAVELLRQALAWHPQAAAIHQALGLAYRQLGKRELAREHLRRVPAHGIDQQLLPLADPLLVELDRARVGARGHDMRAMRALEDGRFDLAAIEFRQSLLSDPDRLYARHGLALALFRAGRLAEAVEALEELLRSDPSHAPSRLLLSRVLAAQGNLRAARQRLESLLENSPDDAEGRLQLAGVCLEERQFAAALEHYTRVLAQAAERSEARLGAGLALIGLGQRRRAFQVLLQDGPAGSIDPQVALLAARLLAASPEPELRDAPRALELARQAWDAQPTLSAAESMAMAEAEAGRLPAAVAWQQEAMSAAGAGRPWMARRLALYRTARPVREPWAPGEELSRAPVLAPDVDVRGAP